MFHFRSLLVEISSLESENQKFRFEYLQQRVKNGGSISAQITEICINGTVIYLSIKDDRTLTSGFLSDFGIMPPLVPVVKILKKLGPPEKFERKRG